MGVPARDRLEVDVVADGHATAVVPVVVTIPVDRCVVDVTHDVGAAMRMRMVAVAMSLAVVVTVPLAAVVVVAMTVVAPVVAIPVAMTRVVAVAVAVPLVTAMIAAVAVAAHRLAVMTVVAGRVGHRAAVITHALVGAFMSIVTLRITAAVAAMVVGTGKTGTQCQGQGQQQAGEQTTFRVFHDIPPS